MVFFLALNYLTPVVNGKKWKHDTLKSIDATGLIPIISLIPNKYRTLEHKNVLTKILDTTKSDCLQEFWLLNNVNL